MEQRNQQYWNYFTTVAKLHENYIKPRIGKMEKRRLLAIANCETIHIIIYSETES